MYFGVDYYPEPLVYPYAGTAEQPEAQWLIDAQMMAQAGVNIVRMGEFAWGLYEREEGKFDFSWMRRAMDIMKQFDIKVILGTPTAAPPIWLSQKHPSILPHDEMGLRKSEGSRRAYCLNSDIYWSYSQKIVQELASALGDHPQLIAWQIDNGIGGHGTECSFNDETKEDWHRWLEAKYETTEKLNHFLGLNFWGQIVSSWEQVPMPRHSPTFHNPALVLDWKRFSSDTIVAFVRMQKDILHKITPHCPVTTNLRAISRNFDHFDVAEVLDFVSLDSNATIRSRGSDLACEIDIIRSLKKNQIQTPNGNDGFWVIEQKAGNVSWQDVNSLVRPGVVRLFTYQLISRGANGVLYFLWRQPRIGSEKFYGAVLDHAGNPDGRVYKEISQIGEEMKLLAPALQGTKVVAETCILYTHDNDWTMNYGWQPNRHFHLRDHIQLFYNALHDRNIAVDFARPTDDLSQYKIVFAPSLHLMAGGEADRLRLFVENGGTLVATCNTGLVDEHNMAPDTGIPHDLQDVFGLEIEEFDPLPPGEENHLTFKGAFTTSHLHPAKWWCDVIQPKGCQILAVFGKDFYAGQPALTINTYGSGKAIYIGTVSHQFFYYDLMAWLRQLCSLETHLRVPDTVEVSVRQKDDTKIYFLLNHQSTPVKIQFLKPMHDFLTSNTFSGSYDLPPHGVLVLDERYAKQ